MHAVKQGHVKLLPQEVVVLRRHWPVWLVYLMKLDFVVLGQPRHPLKRHKIKQNVNKFV